MWIYEKEKVIMGLFTITGCGSKNTSKAKIVDNEGNNVEMSVDDLIDVRGENSEKFDKYYKGADIEFTDNIKRVLGYDCSEISGEQTAVLLETGWRICVEPGLYDFSEVDSSTKLHVKGVIVGTKNSDEVIVTGKDSNNLGKGYYMPQNIEIEFLK